MTSGSVTSGSVTSGSVTIGSVTSVVPAGTLITLAPSATELSLLLRLALDAEQIGATRIHLPADLDEPLRALAALRDHTTLIISAAAAGPAAELADLVSPPIGTAGRDVLVTPTGLAVLVELIPEPAQDPAAVVTDLAARIGRRQLPVSVACHGPLAIPALLTALAAGAHIRVGTAGAGAGSGSAAGPRADVTLAARAAGIARLIGRPALSAAQARALLQLG